MANLTNDFMQGIGEGINNSRFGYPVEKLGKFQTNPAGILLGVAAYAATTIVLFAVFWWIAKNTWGNWLGNATGLTIPMRNRQRLKNRFQNPNYGTNATDFAVANQISTQADVANYAHRPLLMHPYQLKSYMNKLYPPSTTSVTPGGCVVSSENDCPKDLYWKCNTQAWSKEAIGEALALSSVGSYYLPSGVEEENLHKVIALAHEPVTAACRDAGDVSPGGFRTGGQYNAPALGNLPSAPTGP